MTLTRSAVRMPNRGRQSQQGRSLFSFHRYPEASKINNSSLSREECKWYHKFWLHVLLRCTHIGINCIVSMPLSEATDSTLMIFNLNFDGLNPSVRMWHVDHILTYLSSCTSYFVCSPIVRERKKNRKREDWLCLKTKTVWKRLVSCSN